MDSECSFVIVSYDAMEVLSMLGIVAEWVHDGKEAVDWMKTSSTGYYDCVFMFQKQRQFPFSP